MIIERPRPALYHHVQERPPRRPHTGHIATLPEPWGHAQPCEPVTHSLQGPGHRGEGPYLLDPSPGTRGMRHPQTTHHLGLTDVQRRYPLNRRCIVRCLLQHLAPPTPTHLQDRPPAGVAGTISEADPRARSNNEGPNSATPGARLDGGLNDQGATTSTGDRIHFQP